MASDTEWPSTTIQYRLNLSNALYPVSPALSALHASRAAALHPEVSAILRPSHCPKCGTYRFSGDHPTYPPKRRRHKQSAPPLLRCRLCGVSIDAVACGPSPPTDTSAVPVRLPSNVLRTGTVATNQTVQGSASTSTLRPATSPPVTPSRSQQSHRKSHAKTSDLKDMLSRDRKREEEKRAHDKRKGDHEGLAAFLKQL